VKPSERIEQLSREIAMEHLGDAPLGELHNYKNLDSTRVEAITRYLNEQHEEGAGAPDDCHELCNNSDYVHFRTAHHSLWKLNAENAAADRDRLVQAIGQLKSDLCDIKLGNGSDRDNEIAKALEEALAGKQPMPPSPTDMTSEKGESKDNPPDSGGWRAVATQIEEQATETQSVNLDEAEKDAQYNCPPRDVLELQRQLDDANKRLNDAEALLSEAYKALPSWTVRSGTLVEEIRQLGADWQTAKRELVRAKSTENSLKQSLEHAHEKLKKESDRLFAHQCETQYQITKRQSELDDALDKFQALQQVVDASNKILTEAGAGDDAEDGMLDQRVAWLVKQLEGSRENVKWLHVDLARARNAEKVAVDLLQEKLQVVRDLRTQLKSMVGGLFPANIIDELLAKIEGAGIGGTG
jgi:hypothetical protein